MPLTRSTAAYRLWRTLRLSRGGRALARARAARLTPGRLARHRAAALAVADPSYAGEWDHLDGLLRRLELGVDGFAVDLAAGDGVTGSCTLPLFRDRGWRGVAIECDPTRYALLAHACAEFPMVEPVCARVAPSTVVDLLRRAGAPEGFTLLNLDIDSFDLEIAAEVIPAFRPLVVDMEVNEKIPPPVRFAMRYDPEFRWDEGHCYGCSLAAAADILLPLGYRLEGLEYNNAFFVRAEVAEAHGVRSVSVEDAYASGYAGRADRAGLFPWNADMEELQSLEPARAVEALRARFRRARASFALQLEPLGGGWARGGAAER
jgi:hypothetical protein